MIAELDLFGAYLREGEFKIRNATFPQVYKLYINTQEVYFNEVTVEFDNEGDYCVHVNTSAFEMLCNMEDDKVIDHLESLRYSVTKQD